MENDSKENKVMSKEEILAKSREENKHWDERELQSIYKAAYTATSVGFLLYGIISIVLALFDKFSYEMNIVTFAIIGTMYTIWGIKTTKRKPFFLAAGTVCVAASIASLICWILQLCGIG